MKFPLHSEKVLQQFNKQRQNGQLCDCTFVVDGIVFKAHKAVLAACSQYFRMLFLDHKEVVDLDISSATGLGVVLDFMYTSKLDLTAENVECVQVVASFLQMEEIVMSCKVFRPSSTKDEQIKQPVNSQVKEVQRSSPVPQTTPAAPLPTTNKKIETTKPAVEMTPMFVAQPPPGLLVKQDSWDHPEGEMEIELGDSEDDNTEEEEVGEGEGEDEDEDEDVNDDDDDDDDDEEEDADDADDTFIDDENDDDYVPGHNLNSLDGNGHRMRTRSAKQQRKGQSVRGDPSLKMERGIQEIDSETEMELDKGSIKRKLENDFEDSMSDDSVKLLPNEISYTQRKALHSYTYSPPPPKRRSKLSMEIKLQVLEMVENGVANMKISERLHISLTSIKRIRKMKDFILETRNRLLQPD